MPWRTAPAWPDSPPPATLTVMSKLSTWSVSTSGCLAIMIEVWRPKNSAMSRPLTVILPLPFFRNTRATLDLRRPVPLFHSPIIRGSLDFQRLGLLGAVRMLGAAVHLQLLDHRVAERALGQHALDGLLERTARVARLQVAKARGADATRIAGVAVVHLVQLFRAGDAELGGIDDDDEVAGVDVRRVNGLVLAAQTESNFAGYSSEDLVGRVNHKPLVHHVSGFRAEGLGHEFSLAKRVWRALFCGRNSSGGNLLGSRLETSPRSHGCAAKPAIIRKINGLRPVPQPRASPQRASGGRSRRPGCYHRPMFSYRHAFHAGNHADVLKHMVLIAVLRHLTLKETALTVVDTHAGAGLYRLDGDYATHSGEAGAGVLRLFAQLRAATPDSAQNPAQAGESSSYVAINSIVSADATVAGPRGRAPIASALRDYLELVAGFNPDGRLRVYPGSPFVIQRLLRAEVRDRLKLFELHPTDARALAGNIAQLDAGRMVSALAQDGFEALRGLLPPPSRRALVLIDPSYEIKSDYARVAACVQDGLKRFATGSYLVWYPLIPRPEAHDLPRRLRTLANHAGRPWLDAQLAIGQDEARRAAADPAGPPRRPGLTASGVFVINPPHTLRASIEAALPQLLQLLGRGRGQRWAVTVSPSNA